MIVNGGSRSNGAFFARHLVRADQNERVDLVEMRGLAAETIPEAFAEMKAVASGTRCTRFFYHANLNPTVLEQLTPAQWTQAVDILEHELGLTGQPRFVVEHVKEGRTHRHVIWSRIDPDSMRAISDALTYPRHERAAREIERLLNLTPVPSVLVKARATPRPERRPKDWETMRAGESGIDPKAMKEELTALWHASDSGPAFAASLAAHGYILARGDRRDFVLIDRAGGDHSLARRLAGVKAAELRARLAGIDQAALPSVAEARAQARQGTDSSGANGSAFPPPSPKPVQDLPIPAPEAHAALQVRAAASLYTARRARPRPALPAPARLPRFPAPVDAAMAAAQVQIAARAVEALAQMPSLLADLAETGLHWWQRAAHHAAELAEDARATVQSWGAALRHGVAVRIPGGRLDLE